MLEVGYPLLFGHDHEIMARRAREYGDGREQKLRLDAERQKESRWTPK